MIKPLGIWLLATRVLAISVGLALGAGLSAAVSASELAGELGCREAAEAGHYECPLLVGIADFQEVAGDLDCSPRKRGYWHDCWLPFGKESIPDAETFVACGSVGRVSDGLMEPGSGFIQYMGALNQDLSVFQHDPNHLGSPVDTRFLFWVYSSAERKLVFSGMANMRIKVLDIDGRNGNEILVRHNVARYHPLSFVHENSPHLVAYSVSDGGAVQMLDPLKIPAFAAQNQEELASLKQLLAERLNLAALFKKESIFDEKDPEEQYILFQLQLIDYQSRSLQ